MTLAKQGKVLLLSFLIIASFSCLAQKRIGDFIKSSESDLILKEYSSQLDYLNKRTYRLSPIQNIQFRAQNNRLGSNRDRFGLNFTIANPWEIKNNNRYFRSYSELLQLEKEQTIKEVLALKYLLLIDLIQLKENHSIKKALTVNTSKQLHVLEQQKSSNLFDPQDYTDLKLKEIQEGTEVEETLFRIDQKIREMKNSFVIEEIDTANLTLEQMIAVDKIIEVSDSLLKTELFTLTKSYLQKRVDIHEREYYLEKSNVNLGTIQPNYSPFRYEGGEFPFGLSVGITIPLVNPNKGDMTKRKLDKFEAESDMAVELKNSENKLNDLQVALKSYVERYQNVDKKIKSFDVNKTFNSVGALNSYNPIVLLRFQEQVLKLKKIKGDLAAEIYRVYIDLLETGDFLQKKPLVNYLSEDLEVID